MTKRPLAITPSSSAVGRTADPVVTEAVGVSIGEVVPGVGGLVK